MVNVREGEALKHLTHDCLHRIKTLIPFLPTLYLSAKIQKVEVELYNIMLKCKIVHYNA